MKGINFDAVTLNLTYFYLGERFRYKSLSKRHYFYELPQVTYSGFRDGSDIRKCIGLKPKFTNIEWINFNFNSNLYPDGIRPFWRRSVLVALHLPNQISLRGSFTKNTWPKITVREGHIMIFKMQQLEILKRRNKENDPCKPDELNLDQIILDENLEQLGCKAPYHRTDKNLEVCDSKEKMRATYYVDLFKNEKFKKFKECTIASTLTFTYEEINHDNKERFGVLLYYPNKFKEVVMVRAVDLQTVIGNAGGYIGLFLGKISWKLLKLTIIE